MRKILEKFPFRCRGREQPVSSNREATSGYLMGIFPGGVGEGDRLLRRSPRRDSSTSFVWRSSRKWVKAIVVSAGSLGRAVRVLLATWPTRTRAIPAPPSRMTSTTAAAWPRPACTSAWVRGGWPGDLGENESAK